MNETELATVRAQGIFEEMLSRAGKEMLDKNRSEAYKDEFYKELAFQMNWAIFDIRNKNYA